VGLVSARFFSSLPGEKRETTITVIASEREANQLILKEKAQLQHRTFLTFH